MQRVGKWQFFFTVLTFCISRSWSYGRGESPSSPTSMPLSSFIFPSAGRLRSSVILKTQMCRHSGHKRQNPDSVFMRPDLLCALVCVLSAKSRALQLRACNTVNRFWNQRGMLVYFSFNNNFNETGQGKPTSMKLAKESQWLVIWYV